MSVPAASSDRPRERSVKWIVCCDGTWLNSDNGISESSSGLEIPSNVSRITHALLPTDGAGNPQVTYYLGGVGTGYLPMDRMIGGATGAGIEANICAAYNFLATNHRGGGGGHRGDGNGIDDDDGGDEIYLLGFSRGAFTARSVGGLIGGVGLLTRAGLPFLNQVFQDWEKAGFRQKYRPLMAEVDAEFASLRAPVADADAWLDEYRGLLLRKGWTRVVRVQAIGVWDTVGALGIPTTPLIQKTMGGRRFLRRYRWLDTNLGPHVRNAFHALALDERRAAFAPSVWEQRGGAAAPPSSPPPRESISIPFPGATPATAAVDNNTNNDPRPPTVLRQTWFPGSHSNVGGSYPDTATADITLAWMMDRLRPFLAFDADYLTTQVRRNARWGGNPHFPSPRPKRRSLSLPALFSSSSPSSGPAAAAPPWPVVDPALLGRDGTRLWGCGRLYESCRGVTRVAGTMTRRPGRGRVVDALTERETDRRLVGTAERVHVTVRLRRDVWRGPGVEDRGVYEPRALSGWDVKPARGREGLGVRWVWPPVVKRVRVRVEGEDGRKKGRGKGKAGAKATAKGKKGKGKAKPKPKLPAPVPLDGNDVLPAVLEEDTLGPFERLVLELDPTACDMVKGLGRRWRVRFEDEEAPEVDEEEDEESESGSGSEEDSEEDKGEERQGLDAEDIGETEVQEDEEAIERAERERELLRERIG